MIDDPNSSTWEPKVEGWWTFSESICTYCARLGVVGFSTIYLKWSDDTTINVTIGMDICK